MEPTAEQPVAPPVPHAYQNGDKIRHLQTQNTYVILVSPGEFIKIEATGEPAYGYALVGQPVGVDNPLWFRGQAEVEDPVRFEWVQSLENNKEWVAARDEDYKRFYNVFNEVISAEVAKIDINERTDGKISELVIPQIVKFANDNFGETNEIIVSEPWVVPGSGKGGIAIYVADHVKGYKHEISIIFETLNDRPADMPRMLELEDVTEHHVEGALNNLPIKAVRPTDGQADNPNSYNYYDIHGFVTAGFGGRPPREGQAVAFQDGPIHEVGPTGVTIEALLAISLHRLRKLNDGEFECEENTAAIAHMESALESLKIRTARRLEDGSYNSNQA